MSRILHECHKSIAYSSNTRQRMSKSESHCTGPYDMVDVHSNGTVTKEMDTCINASTFKEYRNTK